MQTARLSRIFRPRIAAAAAALTLGAAVPPGLRLAYEPEILAEGCLAPDFADAECLHFRRLIRQEQEPFAVPDEVQLPLDVYALLLSSNELAGEASPRPSARAGRR